MTYAASRIFDQVRDALLRWCKAPFLKLLRNNYRPERHYMRGSGPKSRPKESKQDVDSKHA